MANQPHPSKHAVTWRLPRELLERVREQAEQNGETVLALVTRALMRELPPIAAGGFPDCAHTVLRDGAETVYRCDLPPGHDGVHQQSGGPIWNAAGDLL